MNEEDMKMLIKNSYSKIIKKNEASDFVFWILEESVSNSEAHSQFLSNFTSIAFKMLNDNDWDADRAFVIN